MGEKLKKQENMRIQQQLYYENVKRVLLSALCCIIMMPVLFLINNFTISDYDMSGTFNGILVCYEIMSIAFVVLSFICIRTRDTAMCALIYRSFWLLFEAFSFVIIFANKIVGSGTTFYVVMLTALMLVPVVTLTEQMYALVAELVYVIFIAIRFDTNGFEIFNIVLFNLLLFAISRYLCARTHDHIRMKDKMRDAENQVMIDEETGLLNQKGLESRCYESLLSTIRNNKRLSILIVDIDDMTKYNNAFGSVAGNECIREVAKSIRSSSVRFTDCIGRVDGGRFMICMEGGTSADPSKLAEKIRTTIESRRIPQSRTAENSFVTVGIGVASLVPHKERDFSDLYDEAEAALCEAKKRGKNLIVYDEQIFDDFSRHA